MNGFLNIYKPRGITSHDVILILRKLLDIRSIGHTGTLDPIAEGVLVVAVGNATRLIEYIPKSGKTYLAKLRFGLTSDTYDTEGKLEKVPTNKEISSTMLSESTEKFLGAIEQIPPNYSAIKIKGKKAYELAREGKVFKIDPKNVNIKSIKIISYNYPESEIEVKCSSGTYIRSLIHDIGQDLGVGAVMVELKRIDDSGFDISNSLNLENTTKEKLEKNLIGAFNLFENKIRLDKRAIKEIRFGRSIKSKSDQDVVFGFDEFNNIVCVMARKGDLLYPKKVFA